MESKTSMTLIIFIKNGHRNQKEVGCRKRSFRNSANALLYHQNSQSSAFLIKRKGQERT